MRLYTIQSEAIDILRIPLAVLGVKPWEYEIISTKTERAPHTLRTVALSQSVCVANNEC